MNVVGLCEDDDALRGVVRTALEREGFEVRATASGTEAVGLFGARPPHVLILDVALPDADGRDVCAALRARGSATPILFLTARHALTDRLAGFHAGGDDYLTKPFALEELIVRVNALLRRSAPVSEETAVVLDPVKHSLTHDKQSVPLTPTEFRLVAALAASPGAVVRRGTLVAAGWPDGAIVNDNTLDAYLTRIRRKLRQVGTPSRIETARGVGYALR